jgi:hypothetical protein
MCCDEEAVVVLTLQDREAREKALEIECVAALKRWVAYGRDLDFTPYLKERVTELLQARYPTLSCWTQTFLLWNRRITI